jgi:ubiquitin thioesterase OTU1
LVLHLKLNAALLILNINGGNIDLSYAHSIRQLIAGVVKSDPQTYSDAFLGRSNSSYCSWIMQDVTSVN